MKVAIIGATGFVGRRVVDEALARGLQVTAIARQKKICRIMPISPSPWVTWPTARGWQNS